MRKWEKLNCNTCPGHCNKKGYKSVSKGSKYCQEQLDIYKPKTNTPLKERVPVTKKIKRWFQRK